VQYDRLKIHWMTTKRTCVSVSTKKKDVGAKCFLAQARRSVSRWRRHSACQNYTQPF